MLEPQRLLSYYSDVASTGSRYNAPACVRNAWTVPFGELRGGGLSSHVTREILLRYSTDHPEVAYGQKNVPLLCCLRLLRSQQNGELLPLLCAEATLDAGGNLAVEPNTHAWVPFDFLDVDELHNGSVALCDLDAYMAHVVAMSALPLDGTWTTFFDRSLDFFNAINGLNEDVLSEHGLEYLNDECTVCINSSTDDFGFARDELQRLATLAPVALDLEGSFSGPLRRLLQDEAITDATASSTTAGELPDDALLAPKMLCGTPGYLPGLEQQDHEALSQFAKQQAGDMLGMRAPKGTNGTAVVLTAMANLYTESALRGDKAPTMVCVGTTNELLALMNLLAQRPTVGQMALSSRWIPRIAYTGSPGSATGYNKRVLGPLPTLSLLHNTDGIPTPAEASCLMQFYDRSQGGDTALYSDAWYTPKASIYYLDCVSNFLKDRVKTLGEARQRLSEVLRHVDQDRCELIDAYSGVCKASELLKQRDGLVERIGHLRRGHTICRKRLAFWSELLQKHPPRKFLVGKAEPDQSAIIARNMQQGEELAQGKRLIADVCNAYREEIAKLENTIDRLRGATQNLAKRIHAAEPEGKRCSSIIARLMATCNLSAEQTELLEASIDGRVEEVSIDALNRVLDQTIRPCEFWLAVHIYESGWIELSQRRLKAPRTEDDHNDTLPFWSTLCPFQFVPSHACTGTFHAWGIDANSRIDLVVLANAHTMDVPRALVAAQAAKRMLVVGSTGALRSPTLRNPTFDEVRTTNQFDADAWAELQCEHLSVSAGGSFFDWALRRPLLPVVSLADTHASYAELDDLRSDLVPDEALRTKRMPAHSVDDHSYALAGIVPSLSYVLVPDSAWEQRGPSRKNRAEALALDRWLNNHLDELLACYEQRDGCSVAILTPFAAQAELLRMTLGEGKAQDALRAGTLAVNTLRDAQNDTWPLVILSATCGPDAFSGLAPHDVATVLNVAAASATDALVLFCGGAWIRSDNKHVTNMLGRMSMVGRLFSMPRKPKLVPIPKGEDDAQAAHKPKAQPNIELREKPLSMTALLKKLNDRGDISFLPTASAVNAALRDVGLIERVKDNNKAMGWRPTPAGREIGILATRDQHGNPYCSYTVVSEAVVANVAEGIAQQE